jgi:hypothetical protein
VIIGVCGGIGSGKTTAVSHLVRAHRFVELSPGKFVQRLLRDLYDLPGEAVYGTQLEKMTSRPELGGASARRVMEKFAELGREFDEDVWLSYALRNTADASRFAMPNLRFPNEHRWIKEQGGVVIRMHVVGETISAPTSETETYWQSMEYDYRVLATRGDVALIYEQLDAIVAKEKTNAP